VSSASPGDVDAAVNAAAAAWESWRRVSGAHRGELLYKLADVLTREHDRLARIETQDNGKIIRETRNQPLFAARCYRFFAGAEASLAEEVAAQAIELGLVDELRMFRYPVVVGGGTTLLPPVTDDIALELSETRTFGSRGLRALLAPPR
jgi:acyl-CoA reductase-like NAD-dependent aldehyde dehydrogenase